MSFNIRYGTASDGKDHWSKRDQLVIDTIKAFDPDLLGTQETLGFQADYLRANLAHMTYVGWSRDATVGGEQCGVLFRTDRFTVQAVGQFWLSQTPDVKFSKSWSSSLPRVATWVRLHDQHADTDLLFLNTHFDHVSGVARRESAGVIRRFLEAQPEDLPVIITGDFNCEEASEPYRQMLLQDRLVDTFRKVHPERDAVEGTFNGFKGTSDGHRIDWILCSPGWKISEAQIVRTNSDGRYPSDHFPVTATLMMVK